MVWIRVERGKKDQGLGCDSGCAFPAHLEPWVPSSAQHKSGMAMHTYRPALVKCRQEDEKFKVTLSYKVSLRPVWNK